MNGQPEFSYQDARDHLDAAERHTLAWKNREVDDAAAYEHLTHAVGSLERLGSVVDGLRGPLASDQVARQTDNADALGEFFGTVVGDREYGFDPDARPQIGGAS